jgi:hypothetical protein
VSALPFWEGEPTYDAVCASYGYGGPFVVADGDPRAVVARFYRAYEKWARDNALLAEYFIFSPKDEKDWAYPGQIVLRAPTVVRRVDLQQEELWMDYKGSVRTNVRAALRRGVEAAPDPALEGFERFLEIDDATMEWRNAGDYS